MLHSAKATPSERCMGCQDHSFFFFHSDISRVAGRRVNISNPLLKIRHKGARKFRSVQRRTQPLDPRGGRMDKPRSIAQVELPNVLHSPLPRTSRPTKPSASTCRELPAGCAVTESPCRLIIIEVIWEMPINECCESAAAGGSGYNRYTQLHFVPPLHSSLHA